MKYAVSYIDWIDHDLTTIIVEAANWHEALHKHPKITAFDHGTFNSDYENAKQVAFDCDCMINVTEIM